jgi:hypothetical protein
MWTDYDDTYEVSTQGEIYHKKLKRMVKQSTHGAGYKVVQYGLVHRIVATAFIPNPQNLPYVDHINCIRTDNRVENLRWVNEKQNCENQGTRRDNTSGNRGISIIKSTGKWRATLAYKNLGHFNTKEEAIQARRKAVLEQYTCPHSSEFNGN